MVVAIAATICAAGLVLFLQHRAISTLQSQTRVILQQVSEQSAADIAAELRRTLDGPVFDTLTAVNHPELRAGRLDLVAAQFAAGLAAYPHVDRFFAWNAQIGGDHPGGGVLRPQRRLRHAIATLGRAMFELADAMHRRSRSTWPPRAWRRSRRIRCSCACSGPTRGGSSTSRSSGSWSSRRGCASTCSANRAARRTAIDDGDAAAAGLPLATRGHR